MGVFASKFMVRMDCCEVDAPMGIGTRTTKLSTTGYPLIVRALLLETWLALLSCQVLIINGYNQTAIDNYSYYLG